MKYIVLDTVPGLSNQPDTPVGWTVLGVAQTLAHATELARNDAQEAWDGWEDKDDIPAERFFHPYLVVSSTHTLIVTLAEDQKVRIDLLTTN
jgi:hypothetical protein